MDTLELHCGGTQVHIDRFGAMFTAEFTVNGQRVNPLFRPAWHGNFMDDAFLNGLQGDFLCAPFGARPESAAAFADEWKPCIEQAAPDAFAHGYPAHHVWDVADAREQEATLRLMTHPRFSSITRRIVCAPDGSVQVTDTLIPSADFEMPLGLHPIFTLPEAAGQAELLLPEYAFAATFPAAVDASSIFVQNAQADARAVACLDGTTCDVTRLPRARSTEELLMLCNVADGSVTLRNRPHGYRITLSWDARLLPNCLLWLSNRGRTFAPWNGQNLCLGIEPIAAAFDLGEDVSSHDNPLRRKDVCTSLPFKKGVPFVLTHSLQVSAE